MPAGDAFQVEGVIFAVVSPRTARVRLANGHELFAFLAARATAALVPGGRVWLRLSPCDLSKGRILKSTDNLRYEGSRVGQETV